MSEFMKYRTLTAQALAEIRERISSGQWSGILPREKEIARILGISRNTVRGAIASLAADDWIIPGGKGFQHTINSAKIPTKGGKTKTQSSLRIIRFLNCKPFYDIGDLSGSLYESLLSRLRPEGFRLVMEVQEGLAQRFSAAKLVRLTSEYETAGWILHRQSKQVQQWFAESGIPTLVTGSVYEGIRLPSIRFDYASSSRHAVLEFLRRGHRRIAFVAPTQRIASEQYSIDAFLAARKECNDAELSLIEHDDTVASISRQVLSSRLGRSPVTAYYVMQSRQAITVFTTMLHAGIRIPQDAAMICRAGARHMDATVLPITHYHHDGHAMGQVAARMISRIVQEGCTNWDPKDILPTFVPGKTI